MAISYKGFDKDLKCRGYQFEVGKTYTDENRPIRCGNGGFHSCINPLDVFNYYEPGTSRFALIECGGEIDTDSKDTKIAAQIISIKAELNIHAFVKAAFDFVWNSADKKTSQHIEKHSSASSATGYRSASSATGDRSASSATGYRSASSATGYSSASSATGDRSASSATGDRSASITTGDSSASSATGDRSASSATGYSSASSATGYSSASSATGDRSASSATGNRSASITTGDSSASSATGDSSASITTGDYSRSSVDGKSINSVAVGVGYKNKAKATHGCWIILAEWDEDMNIKNIKSAQAGVTDGVKADTWYELIDGAFVEVAR